MTTQSVNCWRCGKPCPKSEQGTYMCDCTSTLFDPEPVAEPASTTQSVCKHCQQPIKLYVGVWIEVGKECAGVYCSRHRDSTQQHGTGFHEPASTGESEPESLSVQKRKHYMHGGHASDFVPAARPSEPSAPRSPDRTTAIDVAGEIDYMKSVEAAPQTSADIAPYCCLEGYTSNGTRHTCAAPQPVSGDAPKVEEIARQIAEKLVAHHLSVWQGLEKAIDLYTELIIPFLRPYYFPAAGASKDE